MLKACMERSLFRTNRNQEYSPAAEPNRVLIEHINSEALYLNRGGSVRRLGRLIIVPPALAAIAYPLLLAQFHVSVTAASALAPVWFVLALTVPVLGFAFAFELSKPRTDLGAWARSARRFSYLVIAAPTLFTFMGVLTYMAKAPISDPWIWSTLWVSLLALAWLAKSGEGVRPLPSLPRWRVAHGVSGALLALFVLFHLGNHLVGLIGPGEHKTIMNAGRVVYRSALIEPLLVTVFLFQVVTGLRLAWRWSAEPADGFGVFQIASGGYLSLYVLGHMNSVFVFARTYLKIDTGWNFATGAPTGLLLDPWNIRLAPHYWFGVFLVLGHLAAGLRVVLLAHDVPRPVVNLAFFVSLAMSFSIATAILLGMCGVRI